jgi:DMSO/TMAO reductase YedYZ molybdopterin-dependent catalytic subunit
VGARNGAVAGGFAAALATVAMLLLRLLADVPSLPELLQEWITTWLPVTALGALLAAFEGGAKPLSFALLFALCIAVGAAVGALLGARWGRRPASLGRLLLHGLLTGIGLLTLGLLVLRPLGSLPGIAAPFLLYGLLLSLLFRWLSPVPATPPTTSASPLPGPVPPPSRRQALERLAWGGVALAGSVALWRFFAQAREGGAAGSLLDMGATPGSRGTRPGPDGLPAEATSSADFYVVSKNLRDPRPDPDAWRLHVNGLVARPFVLTLDELRALPHQEQWQTMVCISNGVGGDYAANALWRGVPVSDLLALSGGLPPRASRVVLRAADYYSDSIPLALARNPATLVVTEMNGEPLPPSHGAPARLLVPGLYGIKHVKWLESLEVVDTTYRGYWQRRGWSDSAVIKTISRIDFPSRGTVPAAQATRIAGMAYAGDRGISRVEVSEDDGATWRPAQLSPPRGPLSWVFWEAPWSPARGAQVRLTVRAVDGNGQVQTTEAAPALPDGASGLHSVTVRVS